MSELEIIAWALLGIGGYVLWLWLRLGWRWIHARREGRSLYDGEVKDKRKV